MSHRKDLARKYPPTEPCTCAICVGYCARPGMGPKCHAHIEKSWNTPTGLLLIQKWCKLSSVWEQLDLYRLEMLKTS